MSDTLENKDVKKPLTQDDLNNILTKVENVVDNRINQAKKESLVDSHGHVEWVKVALLSVFTLSNLAILFLHGTHLSGILQKIDSLETLIGIAARSL